MSVSWSVPQTSWLRAWMDALFSFSALDRGGGERAARPSDQGAICPASPLHPGLASTAHLAPLGHVTGRNWPGHLADEQDDVGILLLPGAALGRAFLTHVLEMGLRPQGVTSLAQATRLLQGPAGYWRALVVDLDAPGLPPDIRKQVAGLGSAFPWLAITFLSDRSKVGAEDGRQGGELHRPFSLQQLEAALDSDARPSRAFCAY